MDAKIILELTAKNLCNPDDFGKGMADKTFSGLVNRLIKSEGLFGIVEDKYKIIAIEPK